MLVDWDVKHQNKLARDDVCVARTNQRRVQQCEHSRALVALGPELQCLLKVKEDLS